MFQPGPATTAPAALHQDPEPTVSRTAHRTAPAEPAQTRPVLYVPVRAVAAGCALRLFRQNDGSRCAVAFTSAAALTALLGDDQRSVQLSEPALRALIDPLGAGTLIVDPRLIAPPVTPPDLTPLHTPAPLAHSARSAS